MIFCARATRGLRRPSQGLMARLGVPVGGRVKRLCAVEDSLASLEGNECQLAEIADNLGDHAVTVSCSLKQGEQANV